MVTTHNLGFPRIGAFRELKFAQEKFWRGETDAQQLQQVGRNIRAENWLRQEQVDWLPVGDFSLYDQVLDTSFLLGNVPQRVAELDGDELTSYFRVARGRSAGDNDCQCVHAGEMTKWFDTNYHYIVPEVTSSTQFSLNAGRLLRQIEEAKSLGKALKPVIIGPVTYLGLCKAKDNSNPLDLLDQLIPIYGQLLVELADAGATWVQIDEPLLVTELNHEWQQAYERAYHVLKSSPCKLLLATYFGELQENLRLVCNLPVAGVHIDAISAAHEVPKVIDWLPEHKVLSLGVISGRNIWKTDLNKTLDTLEPIHERLKDRLWLAPSCSLLHVPVDLTNEQQLDPELKQWLAFAVQKVAELATLQQALNHGRESVATELQNNRQAVENRQHSVRIHNPKVQQAIAQVTDQDGTRQSAFSERSAEQRSRLKLPAFPTTTIGSFPQTNDIRQTRAALNRPFYSVTFLGPSQ